MDPTTVIDVLSRWAHVGAAIVLIGGSVFMRFLLMPAAVELPDDEHQALRQRIMQRWKRIVMIGIGLLLLSGFWNYYRKIETSELNGLYHGLMGTKILLAFGAFFLASALTGRSPGLEQFRTNAKKWLLVLIALTAAVVAIAGFLKVTSASQPGLVRLGAHRIGSHRDAWSDARPRAARLSESPGTAGISA